MPREEECDDKWPDVLGTGEFWLSRQATKLYWPVDMVLPDL